MAGYEEVLLREMARVGGGTFHDVSDEAGTRALLRALRNLDGLADEGGCEPGSGVRWLPLIALLLLLWHATSDSGRRVGRAFLQIGRAHV